MRKQSLNSIYISIRQSQLKNSPGQNICVDIDKQERNPPNLGPQVPEKQSRLSQNIQTKLLKATAFIFTTQLLKKKKDQL